MSERKIQWGVQIVWRDPVKAGAVNVGEEYHPRWQAFDSKAHADRFTATYKTTLGEMAERMPWLRQSEKFDPDEPWQDRDVAEVNRAERWAVEQYGDWQPTPDRVARRVEGGAA